MSPPTVSRNVTPLSPPSSFSPPFPTISSLLFLPSFFSLPPFLPSSHHPFPFLPPCFPHAPPYPLLPLTSIYSAAILLSLRLLPFCTSLPCPLPDPLLYEQFKTFINNVLTICNSRCFYKPFTVLSPSPPPPGPSSSRLAYPMTVCNYNLKFSK